MEVKDNFNDSKVYTYVHMDVTSTGRLSTPEEIQLSPGCCLPSLTQNALPQLTVAIIIIRHDQARAPRRGVQVQGHLSSQMQKKFK